MKVDSTVVIGFVHGEPEQVPEDESLAAMAATLNAAFAEGAFYVDQDDTMEIDDDKYKLIAREIQSGDQRMAKLTKRQEAQVLALRGETDAALAAFLDLKKQGNRRRERVARGAPPRLRGDWYDVLTNVEAVLASPTCVDALNVYTDMVGLAARAIASPQMGGGHGLSEHGARESEHDPGTMGFM